MTFVVIGLNSGSRRLWPKLGGKLKKDNEEKKTT
jgi:hypothetical protein